MPTINLQVTPGGPLIRVAINVSKYREQALIAAGQAIPTWVGATLLIDTGASGTCIDPSVLQPLGIPPSGAVSMQTPSTNGTPHTCSQYDVQLHIYGADMTIPPLQLDALPVLETVLRPQGIDGLLGRDVLEQCVFIYNPTIGLFTLSY